MIIEAIYWVHRDYNIYPQIKRINNHDIQQATVPNDFFQPAVNRDNLFESLSEPHSRIAARSRKG